MSEELVTIAVGGAVYTAFKIVSVRAAYDEAARSFNIEIAAELGASAVNALFKVGAAVQIYANGDLLLNGYVDRKQPRLTAQEAKITVSGRSKSADLIDSSATHETGNFENKTPLEIGKEISKNIGSKFITDQQLEKIDQYQINPGESCFRCVEKMTRDQGMTITGDANGDAKITKPDGKRHAGGIIEGQNLLTGTADHNGSNRHSTYTVLGQRPFGHGVDALQLQALARDKGVDRNRPLVIVQDSDTTKQRTKKRAKNRKDRAAGHALKANVEVQGFRDTANKIWEPGFLVWFESPFLDIAQDMLIENVTWQQSEKGSITTIGLTDPRSYGGQGGGDGNQSGGEWSMDDSEAE